MVKKNLNSKRKAKKERRKIVRIDEEKCDGCGNCVVNCPEGALKIIGGKARLVKESFCDGLGACIGECPTGALTIEERQAEPFDEEAVRERIKEERMKEEPLPCGCPGSTVMEVKKEKRRNKEKRIVCREESIPSRLRNWPIQIHLVPPNAPYLKEAELLVAADCTPCAFADFHYRFLNNRILLLGCPKLHDAEFYRLKLYRIFKENDIKSVDVVFMEVPCCYGLVHLIQKAIAESKKKIPLKLTKVGIDGEIREERLVSEEGVSR
ncbi:MAG: 4Fe-4S binding protein [Planctomycetota bacterium]|nr:4Fe-4S binding protein [Planctomycetota bacterium]